MLHRLKITLKTSLRTDTCRELFIFDWINDHTQSQVNLREYKISFILKMILLEFRWNETGIYIYVCMINGAVNVNLPKRSHRGYGELPQSR